MKYLRLSYPIDENSPVHIGLKKPVINPNYQISKGDAYNTHIITFENHSGTHIDAPAHFIPEGRNIMQYNTRELIFKKTLVLPIKKGERELIEVKDIVNFDLNGVDCIFFKTGFGRYRESDREKYLTLNPGVSSEVMEYIRKNYPGVGCVGIDTVSISRFGDVENAVKSHVTAFKKKEDWGQPLLLIEDLNLNEISTDEVIKTLIVDPWQIRNIDSAPCSVIAQI
ncbi:MAG: cyclase family protein [Methanomicrobiales archaeon]